jgi:hypothetical protein
MAVLQRTAIVVIRFLFILVSAKDCRQQLIKKTGENIFCTEII